MRHESFFDESKEQSQIKSRIVSKYFWAWAKVIISAARSHSQRIAYLDLFAGPGRYRDGTVSTPVQVLRQAIADPTMCEMLVSVFNDKDKVNASSLRKTLLEISGIEKLKHKPVVRCEEVGEKIVQMFERTRLVPTFFFVDPWGYKGLSLALINSVLKNWGCDCIFFFNYNRINMGLNNNLVREHMNVLFGEERADLVRAKLKGLDPSERENLIVEELTHALKEMGADYVLPFTFKNAGDTRTTHHLIFCSKHFRGYEIMKGIMARESTEQDQGVPSFKYSPATEKYPTLFELTRPLDDLEDMLLYEFKGQSLTMKRIYESHSVGRPYIKANYKKALANLESRGLIRASPPAVKRRSTKGIPTFADNVLVSFPQGVSE